MKLTTRQVAEKLGVTLGTIHRLRDSGKLTDVAVRADGKTKHYSLFESTQVGEYLKEYGKGSRKRANGNGNGHVSTPSLNGPSILNRIESRLTNLEEMVKSLVEAWR